MEHYATQLTKVVTVVLKLHGLGSFRGCMRGNAISVVE